MVSVIPARTGGHRLRVGKAHVLKVNVRASRVTSLYRSGGGSRRMADWGPVRRPSRSRRCARLPAFPALPAWYFSASWRIGKKNSGVSSKTVRAMSKGSRPCMRRRLTSSATKAVAPTRPIQVPARSERRSATPAWYAPENWWLISSMASTCSLLRPKIFRVARPCTISRKWELIQPSSRKRRRLLRSFVRAPITARSSTSIGPAKRSTRADHGSSPRTTTNISVGTSPASRRAA